MPVSNTTRICLWSGPRNISTALMYSFAQREDTKVFDEPLYAYYLKNTKADEYHPGSQEVLENMENDGQKVIDMMMGKHEKPVVFFKHMTHHLLDLDRSFMKHCVNIILTRDPMEMLPSYAAVIENPTIDDVGYALHGELIAYFKNNNIPFHVLDSKNVLLDPEQVLNNLCKAIGIPFDDAMLRWEMGARPEDGSWAKYWYKNVHNSSGFAKYQRKTDPFPAHLTDLLHECQPYYNNLKKLAIR